MELLNLSGFIFLCGRVVQFVQGFFLIHLSINCENFPSILRFARGKNIFFFKVAQIDPGLEISKHLFFLTLYGSPIQGNCPQHLEKNLVSAKATTITTYQNFYE